MRKTGIETILQTGGICIICLISIRQVFLKSKLLIGNLKNCSGILRVFIALWGK
jgi:hypothetical protein